MDTSLDENKIEAKPDALVYSSLNAHFSVSIFIEQLLFHLLFPFSIPFFLAKYGSIHAHVQVYDFSFYVR